MSPRLVRLLQVSSFVAALTIGCIEASYRPPVTLSIKPGPIDEATLISYRKLAESDFKAPAFPSNEKPDHVDALTAVFIIVQPFYIHVYPRINTYPRFFEAIPDSFRFEARMSQAHSWLNPSPGGTMRHILDHEQVHFAISELAARRANSQIEAIRSRIRSSARIDSVALNLARQRFDEELARVRKEANDRNVEFDGDTVNGQRFYRNELWVERINREIEETAKPPAD